MSSQSSTSATSSEAISNNSQGEAEGGGGVAIELPTTLESALERIKELRSKRDTLLADKAKTDKEVEKLTKRTRIETLKSLIPRELFSRSDIYEAELDKVYSWQGLSDKDISDIYQAKISSIDSGKRVKQHGSSSIITAKEDKYANFRGVPEFKSAATKIQQAASDNTKLFNLVKKIAGANPNSSNN